MTDEKIMKINDFEWNSKNVNTIVKIIAKIDEKEVTVKKNDAKARVAKFLVEDETGRYILSLWEDNIKVAVEGKTAKISNAYISSYKMSFLDLGRFGSIEIINGKKTTLEPTKETKTKKPTTPKKETTSKETPKIESGNELPDESEEESQGSSEKTSDGPTIRDLQDGDTKVSLMVVINEIKEPRIVKVKGVEHKVADVIISDNTGEISLSLWDDDIGKYEPNETIEIVGGYVKTYKGQLQLSVSKFGAIKKIA